jgi:hypothetical protein
MINRQPAKVTWRDAKTLVINGTDARVIYESVQVENAAGEVMTCFTCGNEGGVGDDRGVTIIRPRVRR